MQKKVAVVAVCVGLAAASQSVFSVHDDILAFPQYEVVFSDSFIPDHEADALTGHQAIDPKSSLVQQQTGHDSNANLRYGDNDALKEEYETMWLHDQEYLCRVPIVDLPPRNETSEAEARLAEQNELARATDRGWELLQDMEGNCLYFISGWWSYSFCYNSDVTQFHQLPPQPGKPPFPPQRDPNTAQYVLGRAVQDTKPVDERENEIQLHDNTPMRVPPKTELQVKGDTRYLVQKMDGGTTCDLTGKPRRIEIQYHCSSQANDRVGWIKEVTTCSYLMIVYTPRLCNDVAFQPPKEHKANVISCQMVVSEDTLTYWEELKTIEARPLMTDQKLEAPVVSVGGVVVGGQKHVGKEGARLPLPKNWDKGITTEMGPAVDIIARSKGKADNGRVEVMSEEGLQKLDLDPKVVEQLKAQLQKLAGDKGWKLEVAEVPGGVREIRGVVDGEDEDEDGEAAGTSQEGSEETYKEEL